MIEKNKNVTSIDRMCFKTLVASIFSTLLMLLLIFLFSYYIRCNSDYGNNSKITNEELISFNYIDENGALHSKILHYEHDADKYQMGYRKGVVDALDSFVLLHLELQLQEEKKTFGEMRDIVKYKLLLDDSN
jgi:hypothetical protein